MSDDGDSDDGFRVEDTSTWTEIPTAWRIRRPWESDREYVARQQDLHDAIEYPHAPGAECRIGCGVDEPDHTAFGPVRALDILEQLLDGRRNIDEVQAMYPTLPSGAVERVIEWAISELTARRPASKG